MGFREDIAVATAPYLQPGEQIQAAMGATTGSNLRATVFDAASKARNQAIVVTDQRILVFKAGRLSFTKFIDLDAVFDRRIRFGEPSGINWKTNALGYDVWIARYFHDDVRRADALCPPPQPPSRSADPAGWSPNPSGMPAPFQAAPPPQAWPPPR